MNAELKMVITVIISLLVMSLLPWQFFGSLIAP